MKQDFDTTALKRKAHWELFVLINCIMSTTFHNILGKTAEVSLKNLCTLALIAERYFGDRMVSTAGTSADGFAMIDLPQLLS